VVRGPLLEEPLPVDPVGKPYPGQRAVTEVRKDRVRDPGVVVDRRGLGELVLRPQDLVEVGERQLAPIDLYLALFALLRDRDLVVVLRGFFAGDFFAGLEPPSSSDLTAARLSSSAAIRSGALVGFGASLSGATTASPFALR
jgi:hypothetical protein